MRFVAGRGRRGEETGSAVAKRHREDAARGAVPKRLVRGAAVAKRQREDANQHREATAIGSACVKRHREDANQHREATAIGSASAKSHREATPPRKAAGKGEAAGFDF